MESFSFAGVTVASEIPLPALPRAAGRPEAWIRRSEVPGCLPGADRSAPRAMTTDREVLLLRERWGRFLIREGREILVDVVEGADAELVRATIYGPALGTLLLQRRALVLHANVVCSEGGCVALAGARGLGKSTISAFLGTLGYPLWSDDLCVVNGDGTRPMVPAGLRRLKLTRTATEHLSGSVGPRIYAPLMGKLVERRPPPPPEPPRPLEAVLVLQRGGSGAPARVPAPIAMELLRGQTYGPLRLAGMGLRSEHFHQIVKVVGTVPVFRYARRFREVGPREATEAVASWLSRKGWRAERREVG